MVASVKANRECEGLLYFISGGIEYDFDGYIFNALPGQVVRLPGGIPYNGRFWDIGPLEFYCINFETVYPDEYEKFPLPYSFAPTDGKSIESSFVSIEKSWHSLSHCTKLSCKVQLFSLLAILAKDYAINTCGYDDHSRIMRYSEYLRVNYNLRDLRISDLSEHFHLSEAHMRRIFAKELGISPSEFLASVRIENAKRMLFCEHEMSIQQISDECGYSSVYYFSSTFHKAVGCSPTEYRESARRI